jgi:hypothetical protein
MAVVGQLYFTSVQRNVIVCVFSVKQPEDACDAIFPKRGNHYKITRQRNPEDHSQHRRSENVESLIPLLIKSLDLKLIPTNN